MIASDELLELLAENQVTEIRVINNLLEIRTRDHRLLSTYGVLDEELMQNLAERGVTVVWGEKRHPLRTAMTWLISLLVMLAVFFFFLRKARGSSTNMQALRKSRVRLATGPPPDGSRIVDGLLPDRWRAAWSVWSSATAWCC